jgi:hypothetical protein
MLNNYKVSRSIRLAPEMYIQTARGMKFGFLLHSSVLAPGLKLVLMALCAGVLPEQKQH